MRFVVIGGGIAGSFASFFLLKENHDVIIVDHGRLGKIETSVFNSGILSSAPDYMAIGGNRAVSVGPRERTANPLWFGLASRVDRERYFGNVGRLVPSSVKLYREFLRGKEGDVDMMGEGLSMFRRRDEAFTHQRRSRGRIVESRELSELGYRWRGTGVLSPEITAHTGKLLNLLKERIHDMGGKEVRAIASLRRSNGGGGPLVAEALLEDGQKIAADGCVVAAGAWSRSVCAPLDFDPLILPARGLTEFCSSGGRRVVDRPATFSDLTISQHDNNTVRLTGFFELMGFDTRYSKAKRSWLFRTAKSRMTRASALGLNEVGAGFRPCTPDQLPVVGPIPRYKNAFIVSGASRKGVTLAPLMGYLIAKAISEKEGADPTAEERQMLRIMSPSRFVMKGIYA